MRTISAICLATLLFASCQDVGSDTQAPNSPVAEIDSLHTIISSLWSTDTTGQPSSTFHTNEQFYLHFRIANRTGKDQSFSGTGPTVELAIYQGDSVVASQFRGLASTHVIYHGVLERDFVGYMKWKAPLMLHTWGGSEFRLEQGTYQAGAIFGIGFDSVALQTPRRITLRIIP